MTDANAEFEVRKIYLSFHGPKGTSFGQELVIEIKVLLNSELLIANQEELFRTAMIMSESMNLGTFDECVEALKKFNGDMNAAAQSILDKWSDKDSP